MHNALMMFIFSPIINKKRKKKEKKLLCNFIFICEILCNNNHHHCYPSISPEIKIFKSLEYKTDNCTSLT